MEQNKKLEEALQASLEDERQNTLEIKHLKETYESQQKDTNIPFSLYRKSIYRVFLKPKKIDE